MTPTRVLLRKRPVAHINSIAYIDGVVILHVDTPDPTTFDRVAFLAIMDTLTLCLDAPFTYPDMPAFGIKGRTMQGSFMPDARAIKAQCRAGVQP